MIAPVILSSLILLLALCAVTILHGQSASARHAILTVGFGVFSGGSVCRTFPARVSVCPGPKLLCSRSKSNRDALDVERYRAIRTWELIQSHTTAETSNSLDLAERFRRCCSRCRRGSSADLVADVAIHTRRRSPMDIRSSGNFTSPPIKAEISPAPK